MKATKKHLCFALLFGILITTSSCGLFRKKNKCNTCPKWTDTPEETFQSETFKTKKKKVKEIKAF